MNDVKVVLVAKREVFGRQVERRLLPITTYRNIPIYLNEGLIYVELGARTIVVDTAIHPSTGASMAIKAIDDYFLERIN